MMVSAALLTLYLGTLLFYTRKDFREYEAFKAVPNTAGRQRYYRQWLMQSLALFGIGSLVGLALIGRLPLLEQPLPAFTTAVSRWLPKVVFSELSGFFFGMLSSAVVSGLLLGLFLRKRGKAQQTTLVGNVEALLPRNKPEKWWAVALALNAGLSEELFFRLLLPVLIYGVFGHVLFALAAAVVIFGLVHSYQGWVGVLFTTSMGTVFTGLYLATGSLWLVVALHALVDLNGLVIQPFLRTQWAKGIDRA